MSSKFSIVPKNIITQLIKLTLDNQLSVGIRSNCVFVFLILMRWSTKGICNSRSVTLLARDSRVSRPTVIKSLNKLRDLGIITYCSRKGGNTEYLINGLDEYNVTKVPYRISSREVINLLQSKNVDKLFSITIYLILTMFYNKEEQWVSMCGFGKIIEIIKIDKTSKSIANALNTLIEAKLIIKKSNSIYEILTNEN